jgi:hypothetical protein
LSATAPGLGAGITSRLSRSNGLPTSDLVPSHVIFGKRGSRIARCASFLLEVAATTPLPEMADVALSVFLDADAPDGERIDALRAISNIGDPRLPDAVTTMAPEPGRWTNRVLRFAVVDLFPDHLRGDELLAILTALQPSKEALISTSPPTQSIATCRRWRAA